MCGKSLSCGGGFFLFGDGTGDGFGRYALEEGREPKDALWKTGSLDLGFRMQKL